MWEIASPRALTCLFCKPVSFSFLSVAIKQFGPGSSPCLPHSGRGFPGRCVCFPWNGHHSAVFLSQVKVALCSFTQTMCRFTHFRASLGFYQHPKVCVVPGKWERPVLVPGGTPITVTPATRSHCLVLLPTPSLALLLL